MDITKKDIDNLDNLNLKDSELRKKLKQYKY